MSDTAVQLDQNASLDGNFAALVRMRCVELVMYYPHKIGDGPFKVCDNSVVGASRVLADFILGTSDMETIHIARKLAESLKTTASGNRQ